MSNIVSERPDPPATQVYAGAVPVTSVVCPSWCTVSQAEHLNDLPAWEGRVIHWSADASGDDWSVRHSDYTYSDGTPDPAEASEVHVEAPSEGMPPLAALRLADAVRKAAVQALGGGQG